MAVNGKRLKMKLLKPDYNNSLINISQSLLKYYNLKFSYQTIEIIDQALSNNPKHVMLILLDGLGYQILKKHLDEDSLLIQHLKAKLTSVFPPTTVAATNALLSGLPPISSGYLGWVQYNIETSTNTVVFTNQDFYNPNHILTESFRDKHLKYEDIFDQIKRLNPKLNVYKLFPDFVLNGYTSFHDQVDKLIQISKDELPSLSYCYWTEPDSTMHRYGPNSVEASEIIKKLDSDYQKLINNIKDDTLVMVIADHGMVEVTPNYSLLNSDLLESFKILPSIEPRAMTVFIRKDADQKFIDYFNKYLSNKFLLMNKVELFKSGLLGVGIKHRKIDSCLGDYILIAKSNEYFIMTPSDAFKYKRQGLTAEEMEIPLILFYKSKK